MLAPASSPSKYAPCKNPVSVKNINTIASPKKGLKKTLTKAHTEVLFAQRFAREPKTAERCAQIGVMLWDQTRRPVAVATAIERVREPSGKEERSGLWDRHIREHCSQYAQNFGFHL